MSLTVTNPSYDKVYPMYAWRDNNVRLVFTQGEGATTLDGEATRVKAPRFQLRDDRGVMDLSGSPVISLAITRPDKTEDLLACTIVDATNGIISCPITASATAIAGQAVGEIRIVSTNGIIKFYGIHANIYKGVSDLAAARSTQFSDFVAALQKLVALDASDKIAELDVLTEDGELPNGVSPVASGVLKSFLEGNFQAYLQDRFSQIKYAHDAHSTNYNAETNPIDDYGSETVEGVYIDDATELGTCYIIKNLNGAEVGLLFCASPPSGSGVTQIAMYYNEPLKWRYRHTNGTWDDWTYLELQKNKDLYNSEDETYFGISNNNDKYPSSKAVYKFIQANAQAIVSIYSAIKDSVLLGYDSLTIDKEYNIHKEAVETYLNDSDYSQDLDYTISTLDNFDFGYEAHGRPDKVKITVPTGGTYLKYKDTVTGREWIEPIGLLTSPDTYIQNLIPNHIYVYQILDTNYAVLKTGTVRGTGKVRMINAGGDTYNIRDIGGWDANGGKLKYGVVYRGGELNSGISITSAQQAFFKDALGVRDELDLRNPGFGSTALGIGVDYLHIPLPYFAGEFEASDYSKYAGVVKRIARDISENKPVYIHCQAGADRTAMACLFIEAICGVSQNDIDRDYELTSFSKEPGTNNKWEYHILRKRNSTTNYHLKNIVSVINTMEGTSFNDRVIRFLLRTGVSIDELNTIRFGLIDGSPTKLSNPYSSVTVTNALTNVSNSNTLSSVVKYQPYEAELKVNNMCKLTSVAITMGGDNAIQYYSNGKISIPIVTGDLVVSAEATQSSIITEDMIADGAVTAGKINDGAVTTDKIADGTITPDKMSFSAVRHVTANTLDKLNKCVSSDTIYEVSLQDASDGVTKCYTAICIPSTSQRTQYLFAQDGSIQFRTATRSNSEWSVWGEWIPLTPKAISFVVRSSAWSGLTYDMDNEMPAYANTNTKVDISVSDAVYNQLILDGCTGLYVTTDTSGNTPTFTLHAKDNVPTADITIQLLLQQIG